MLEYTMFVICFISIVSIFVLKRPRFEEGLTVPVVPEFVLILHPFCEFVTVESEKVISVTVLSDFPPTDPILNPWPPEHVIPVTVIFVPLVTATQSS